MAVSFKIDSRPFFARIETSTKFCFVASQRLSSWHGTCLSLHPTASLVSLDQTCIGNHMDKSAIWEKLHSYRKIA